jgi:hypothetical protein
MLYVQKKCRNVRGDRFFSDFKRKKTSINEKEEVQTAENAKEQKPKNGKGKKNKEESNVIMDENKLKQVEDLVNVLSGVDPKQIKRIKGDRGLIERTESSKVVLTEDNRQILND